MAYITCGTSTSSGETPPPKHVEILCFVCMQSPTGNVSAHFSTHMTYSHSAAAAAAAARMSPTTWNGRRGPSTCKRTRSPGACTTSETNDEPHGEMILYSGVRWHIIKCRISGGRERKKKAPAFTDAHNNLTFILPWKEIPIGPVDLSGHAHQTQKLFC